MNSSNISFEAALKELEEITAKLEAGEVSLEESVELFEKGISLSKICAEKLDNAKQKIVSLEDAEQGENN